MTDQALVREVINATSPGHLIRAKKLAEGLDTKHPASALILAQLRLQAGEPEQAIALVPPRGQLRDNPAASLIRFAATAMLSPESVEALDSGNLSAARLHALAFSAAYRGDIDTLHVAFAAAVADKSLPPDRLALLVSDAMELTIVSGSEFLLDHYSAIDPSDHGRIILSLLRGEKPAVSENPLSLFQARESMLAAEMLSADHPEKAVMLASGLRATGGHRVDGLLRLRTNSVLRLAGHEEPPERELQREYNGLPEGLKKLGMLENRLVLALSAKARGLKSSAAKSRSLVICLLRRPAHGLPAFFRRFGGLAIPTLEAYALDCARQGNAPHTHDAMQALGAGRILLSEAMDAERSAGKRVFLEVLGSRGSNTVGSLLPLAAHLQQGTRNMRPFSQRGLQGRLKRFR